MELCVHTFETSRPPHHPTENKLFHHEVKNHLVSPEDIVGKTISQDLKPFESWRWRFQG
jgi:hypothetical protein